MRHSRLFSKTMVRSSPDMPDISMDFTPARRRVASAMSSTREPLAPPTQNDQPHYNLSRTDTLEETDSTRSNYIYNNT